MDNSHHKSVSRNQTFESPSIFRKLYRRIRNRTCTISSYCKCIDDCFDDILNE
jgi:hypothetical protein